MEMRATSFVLLFAAACGGTTASEQRPVATTEQLPSATADRAAGDEAARGQVTAGYREEHSRTHEHLERAVEEANALPSAPEAERERRLDSVAAFFRDELLPHAAAEEEVLYAAVDREVPTAAGYRYTDSLRHEHRVVEREVDAIERARRSGDRSPEALARLARRVTALGGLVEAHFEAEEEVVLRALDREMTREEFEQQVIRPIERRMRGQAAEAHEPH